MKCRERKYQKYSRALVENGRVSVTDAHQEVAERAVELSIQGLKRLGRYLGGRERLIYSHPRPHVQCIDAVCTCIQYSSYSTIP